MTKRKRNALYKKVLNLLSRDFENNGFRVCLEFNDMVSYKDVSRKNGELISDSDLYPEWFLFKGIKEEDWWGFFKEKDANELRAMALKLCIEMTK